MTDDIAARAALVLETDNLRGGHGAASRVEASLARVVRQLAAQTVPLASLGQFVVTHSGLSDEARAEVARLAGREVDFVTVDAGAGYYEAKNAGFAATDLQRCDLVAFADADCVPDASWLHRLLAPFGEADPPPVVAGRTSYAAGAVGSALTAIDFMYFPSPLGADATRNFYANNVVFRREVFERHRYAPLEGVYRAHCQVLGLLLQEAGVAVRHVPAAHTVHRLPDTFGELLTLRWRRGRDTHGLTPHLVRAYLPPRLRWLARSGPVGPLCVLACRLRFSLAALGRQGLPALHGPGRVGASALVVAFSAVDMAGALLGAIPWPRRRGAAADAQALSYHRP